jgi:hypothetical protein
MCSVRLLSNHALILTQIIVVAVLNSTITAASCEITAIIHTTTLVALIFVTVTFATVTFAAVTFAAVIFAVVTFAAVILAGTRVCSSVARVYSDASRCVVRARCSHERHGMCIVSVAISAPSRGQLRCEYYAAQPLVSLETT